MFLVGDIVKIKEEYCDGSLEKNCFYKVLEIYKDKNSCKIGLINTDKINFPFGLTNLVSFDHIYKVNVKKRLTFDEAHELALYKYGDCLGTFARLLTKSGKVVSGKYISYGLNKIITKEELLNVALTYKK